MIKTVVKILKATFAVAVAVAMIYLVCLASWLFFEWIKTIYADVNPTVSATSITAFASLLIFLIGRYFEQSRDRKAQINTSKIAVYKRFFDFYFDVFSYEKIRGEPMPEGKMMSEMIEFQKDVVFWGTDSVIKEYLNFKDALSEFTLKSADVDKEQQGVLLAEIFKSTARLLSAMRRDIGYTFTSFSAQDLARMQLVDDDDTRITLKYLGFEKKS